MNATLNIHHKVTLRVYHYVPAGEPADGDDQGLVFIAKGAAAGTPVFTLALSEAAADELLEDLRELRSQRMNARRQRRKTTRQRHRRTRRPAYAVCDQCGELEPAAELWMTPCPDCPESVLVHDRCRPAWLEATCLEDVVGSHRGQLNAERVA